MSDPTGSALLARIKELEEALRTLIENYEQAVDPWFTPDYDNELAAAKKALNGHST